MSLEEENKALVRRAYELTNRRDLKAFFELLAPEYVEHLPTGDLSREQVKQYANTFFDAFPDVHFTIEDMVAEGDKVAVRVTWKGTHKGMFMGIAPTGKKIDITNANIIKISGGKWIEFWNVTDIHLVQQLGVIPKQ